MTASLSVIHKAKSNSSVDELLFAKMKDKILGKKYILSVVFVGPKEIQNINKTYRHKDYVTDILSFPLQKNEGEIFICRSKANQKSKLYNRDKDNFLLFLFIHGLVHLKGFEHGSKMDKEEEKFRNFFHI